MAQFSDYAVEAMGFHLNDEGVELTASFFCLRVFEYHGISLADGGIATIEGQVSGVKYAAAIGVSVNELCNELLSDDFVDDEPGWQAEKKCSPPYLMVRFGPTPTHSVTPRHLMMLNGDITLSMRSHLRNRNSWPSRAWRFQVSYRQQWSPCRFLTDPKSEFEMLIEPSAD